MERKRRIKRLTVMASRHTKGRLKERNMYFTRCTTSVSLCKCVCASLRYRQPMQEMHVTYAAYVTTKIQMKKSLFILFRFLSIVPLQWHTLEIKSINVELFCFVSFSSFPLFLASHHQLTSTPPSMLCSDFLKCRQIRMSILMMVWFGFTYLSFPLLCFPLARIFSDCELFPCLFSPVIKKEFIKSIFNLHHKHKKEQTNLQPRLSSNSDTCTHINGT